jgi:hypothetical protein
MQSGNGCGRSCQSVRAHQHAAGARYPSGQVGIENVASALVTAGIKVNPNEFPTPPKILSPQNVEKIMNSHRSCSLESA